MDSNKAFLNKVQKTFGLSNQQVGALLRQFPMPVGEEITREHADHIGNLSPLDQTLDPLSYVL